MIEHNVGSKVDGVSTRMASRQHFWAAVEQFAGYVVIGGAVAGAIVLTLMRQLNPAVAVGLILLALLVGLVLAVHTSGTGAAS